MYGQRRPATFLGLTGLCLATARPYCTLIYRIIRTYVLRYETIVTILVLWMLYLYIRWYSEAARNPDSLKRDANSPSKSWVNFPGFTTVFASTFSHLFGSSEHVQAFEDLKSKLGEFFDDLTQGKEFQREAFSHVTKQAPSQSWEASGHNWAVYARTGARLSMEDRFEILHSDQFQFFGVYDGHGGEQVSTFLEQYLGKTSLFNYRKTLEKRSNFDSKQWNSIVSESIENLDKMCMATAPRAAYYAGSTLLAATILENRYLTVFNVGDSRAILCDKNGNSASVTTDHKPNLPLERARIEQSGGFVAFNGVWRVLGILATSRAVGDAFLKNTGQNVLSATPDCHVFDLKSDTKHKYLILATDGLWDVFTNQQVAEILNRQMSSAPASLHMSIHGDRLLKNGHNSSNNLALQNAAKTLVDAAIQRGSMDNVSVLIVDLVKL